MFNASHKQTFLDRLAALQEKVRSEQHLPNAPPQSNSTAVLDDGPFNDWTNWDQWTDWGNAF